MTVIVLRLHHHLVRHKRGRPRHHELRDVGHADRRPFLLHVLLTPHDLIEQAGTVGLEARQRLRSRNMSLLAHSRADYTVCGIYDSDAENRRNHGIQ